MRSQILSVNDGRKPDVAQAFAIVAHPGNALKVMIVPEW